VQIAGITSRLLTAVTFVGQSPVAGTRTLSQVEDSEKPRVSFINMHDINSCFHFSLAYVSIYSVHFLCNHTFELYSFIHSHFLQNCLNIHTDFILTAYIIIL